MAGGIASAVSQWHVKPLSSILTLLCLQTGDGIVDLVVRLSAAATRERTAAMDEMQRLRKKIIQQQAQVKRSGSGIQPALSGAIPVHTAQYSQRPPPVRPTRVPMVRYSTRRGRHLPLTCASRSADTSTSIEAACLQFRPRRLSKPRRAAKVDAHYHTTL